MEGKSWCREARTYTSYILLGCVVVLLLYPVIHQNGEKHSDFKCQACWLHRGLAVCQAGCQPQIHVELCVAGALLCASIEIPRLDFSLSAPHRGPPASAPFAIA